MRRLAALLLATLTACQMPVWPVGNNATTRQGRCTYYETAMHLHAPPGGWDVNRMSRYSWRESHCTPNIRSRTRDSGLLQINDINLPYLRRVMHQPTLTSRDLMNPITNIIAAAHLCTYWRNTGHSCYHPWG